MSTPDRKFQIELSQKLYDQQVSRRDSIRSTLGVPLAALSFAAFGFGALATQTRIQVDPPFAAALVSAMLFYTAAALFLFLRAVGHVTQIDYQSTVALPEVLDLDTQRREMRQALAGLSGLPAEFDRRLDALLLEGIHKEYVAKAQALARKNDFNLDVQARLLFDLVFGVACLIVAIVLAMLVKLLFMPSAIIGS